MQRGYHVFGKESQGVLYGQETRTPHFMRISLISDFLIPAENELALFGVSGKFIDQPRMGFRVVESELG